MSEEKRVTLELSDLELRILLELCARQILRDIYHGAMTSTVTSVTMKITDALAPEAETDVREKISG